MKFIRTIFSLLFLSVLFFQGCSTGTPSDVVIQSNPGSLYNVKDFGAIGDGKTLNTQSIQQAVDVCAESGGGTVYIPPGEYATGPIFLRSNINFHISQGATLLGDTAITNYPSVEGRWEGIDREIYASMLTGHGLRKVSITGRGILDGRGEVWWRAHEVTDSLRDARGIEGRAPDNPPDAPLKWPRPRMINLYNCENVLIGDLTIIDSPAWTVHFVYCNDVTVDNITIHSPYESHNTYGINPESSSNIRISNCYIDTGDDCITIKSGYNEYGREVGIPWENIVVTNCTFKNGRGGVVVGSEMSGGVRNLTVSNCVYDGTLRGLRIKTARGRGGYVKNYQASNLMMRNIIDATFSITTSYGGGGDGEIPPVTEKTPRLRNVQWGNVIIVESNKVADIGGLPEMPLSDFTLTNIQAESVKEGIFITYTENVYLNNIFANPEYGPALAMNNVRNAEIDRFMNQNPDPDMPVIQFTQVTDALLESCYAPEGTGTFMELIGVANKNIILNNNRLANARTEKMNVTEATGYIPAPTAVRETISKELGEKFTIDGVSRDMEEGQIYYEVDAALDGREVELIIRGDGTLLRREDE